MNTVNARRETPVPKAVLHAIFVVFVLNVLFLLVAIYVASWSTRNLETNAKSAFARGDLVDQVFLTDDTQRGVNQYSDCVVEQLAITDSPNLLEKALAPKLYVSDDPYSGVCHTLRRIVYGEVQTSRLYVDRYARYWHGYLPVSAVLLRVMELHNVRTCLKLFVLISLAFLFAVAIRSGGPSSVLGLSISVSGALFWGIPYFGQGLIFAPGDGLLILGLAAMLLFRSRLSGVGAIVPFCSGFGALTAYFESLTGQLPIAAGWLFVATYLIRDDRDNYRPDLNWNAWYFAATALLSFALGAGLTIITKQALALVLVGDDVVQQFIEHLRLYSSLSTAPGASKSYLSPFAALLRHSYFLTYYSKSAALILLLAAAMAWLSAAYFAYRSGTASLKSNFFAHTVGAISVPAWVLLLPTHSTFHAFFMVRILIVPIALGWGALVVQLVATRQSPVTEHNTSNC
jgi:hypothetical protein